MTYTIKQAAERMGVTVPTLRYYDKEGLLPFVDKKPNGTRVFKEDDFKSLGIITCLKNSGLSIKDTKDTWIYVRKVIIPWKNDYSYS